MSEDNDPKKKISESERLNTPLSEEERKELVEKIKASLFLEDQESVQLYASLFKNSIP